MKYSFLLFLLFSVSNQLRAKTLSAEQLKLIEQVFCKEINGAYNPEGVAPFGWELSTLVQVPGHDASTRFARSYNTTLDLVKENSKYLDGHKRNLELQRKFYKEFFYEQVADERLKYEHFIKSVDKDTSDPQNPAFIFKKDGFKVTCTLKSEIKAKPCDFNTLAVIDESGKKFICKK